MPSHTLPNRGSRIAAEMALEELFEELFKLTHCAARDLNDYQPAFNRLVLSSNLRRPIALLSLRRLADQLCRKRFQRSTSLRSPLE